MQKFVSLRIFFLLSFILLWFGINCGALKSNDIHANQMDKVIYPKGNISRKNLSLKSLRKHKIDLAEKFQHLSEMDLAFIKDLDKQFTKYGSKVKIKVENGNVTTKRKGKNGLKRTLEKSLGYGYSKQYDNHNHYEYNAPKYMIYPYSQEDIVPQNSNYYLPPKKPITTVTIEPSYSFELETETYIQPSQHQQQDESLQHEPVLILNIPGSQEYAEHLKNLLQQYLQLKAAQYSQFGGGQQTQSRGKTPQYHINQSGPTSQIQYVYENYTPHNGALFEQHTEENYQQNFNYNDDQSYYASSSVSDKAPKYSQNYAINVNQPIRPLLYYIPNKQYSPEAIGQSESSNGQNVNNNNIMQYILLSAPVRNQSHLIYLTEDYNHGKERSETTPALTLNENNPRKSHTRVIFTQNTKHASSDYQSDYLLPSIKPKEYYPAASIPIKHQDFQIQNAQQQDTSETETNNHNNNNNNEQIITITQRPFNYHAHNTKPYPHGQHDIMVLTTYK